MTVMRACNGCRKRKIKCDAATTNTWPCTACLRLKLVCVPPTIGQDGDQISPAQGAAEAEQAGYPDPTNQPNIPPTPHELMQSNFASEGSSLTSSIPSYGMYSSYIPQNPGMYAHTQAPEMALPHHPFQEQYYPMAPSQPLPTTDSGVFVNPEQSTAENLTEALGELKIDETGIGKNEF
jgi:Fungal Zn(2)-Cys(6) binuclear cluster domain